MCLWAKTAVHHFFEQVCKIVYGHKEFENAGLEWKPLNHGRVLILFGEKIRNKTLMPHQPKGQIQEHHEKHEHHEQHEHHEHQEQGRLTFEVETVQVQVLSTRGDKTPTNN